VRRAHVSVKGFTQPANSWVCFHHLDRQYRLASLQETKVRSLYHNCRPLRSEYQRSTLLTFRYASSIQLHPTSLLSRFGTRPDLNG
jgi:hypothetical protein